MDTAAIIDAIRTLEAERDMARAQLRRLMEALAVVDSRTEIDDGFVEYAEVRIAALTGAQYLVERMGIAEGHLKSEDEWADGEPFDPDSREDIEDLGALLCPDE